MYTGAGTGGHSEDGATMMGGTMAGVGEKAKRRSIRRPARNMRRDSQRPKTEINEVNVVRDLYACLVFADVFIICVR